MNFRVRAVLEGLAVPFVTIAAALLLASLLVWFSPGYGIDGREADPTISDQVLARLTVNRGGGPFTVVRKMLHGDFGYSMALDAPVADLIAERGAVTLGSVSGGLAMAWSGAVLGVLLVFWLAPRARLLPDLLAAVLLAVPTALVSVAAFLAGAPVSAAITLALFPRLYLFARNILRSMESQPHVLHARAHGLSPGRVFKHALVRPALPELAALAAVSIRMALGAVIPAEAICDSPGLGQLAWKATLGRDLALLVPLTLLMTGITVFANTLSGISTGGRAG
ncbi:MAG: ABC transporter permease subunit [Bryobacterales bacterium]|nr:ABC transporter permease subunit [Bryobacterales bacterium]